MKISMIGCGKLGLPCAEVMSTKHDVVGYDTNPEVRSWSVKMQGSIQAAVEGQDIIFIAVPTPHDPLYDGSTPTHDLEAKDFDYTAVKSVLTEVARYAKPHQIVVLISTVLPGTVRREFQSLVTGFQFVYNPYLIAMGTVEWDMINPEMVIIGTEDGSTTGAGHTLTKFYKTIMQNDPRYVVGTWEEAESIKIFYNTWISTKIGLVNMMQDVAVKLGHCNVDVVTKALAESTQRITGPKYMTAGMGDGGACHPRDNIALRCLSQRLDLGYDMFGAVMQARDAQALNMAQYLESFGLPVVIAGKTYKPGVPFTTGSPSVLVGSQITKVKVYYMDVLLGEYPPHNLGAATYLLAHSDVVTYAYDEVQPEVPDFSFNAAPGSIIVDPWRKQQPLLDVRVIHYGNTRG